jgi:hypothetical protein
MKTGIALLAFFTVVISVRAQEYDDMYFRSKDRAKINADRLHAQNVQEEDVVQSKINPTDSYSARNVNPEYTSRTRFNDTAKDDAPYFISGYNPVDPTGVNGNLSSYNPGGFYSPYYGNNSMFNNPYGYGAGWGSSNPYRMGLMSSFGCMFGGMGSGFYGSMGYGSMWGSPYDMFWNNYYGMNNMWGSYYSPFNNYYGYGYYGRGYYPGTIVVINNGDNGRNVSYQKRMNRSNNVNNIVDRSSRNDAISRDNGTVGGRTRSSANDQQSQYYDRSWKRNTETTRTRTYWEDNSNTTNSRSSWSNGSNGNSGGRTRSSWDSPSRNSWSDNNSNSSFGGGSRSSGGSHSSGGSSGGSNSGGGGGHSRGRSR